MRLGLFVLPVAICAIALSGCTARQFTAMPMSQAGDDALTCAAIQEQINANDRAAADFISKDKNVERKNVARNVAGVVPFVGILATLSTDLSNEEQVKARAILDRNERLTYLQKQKGCLP